MIAADLSALLEYEGNASQLGVFADSALRAPGAFELALTTEGAGPDTAQNTFLMQVRFVPAR
jgi:hypothetical protein